jgi:hypothetical protein
LRAGASIASPIRRIQARLVDLAHALDALERGAAT